MTLENITAVPLAEYAEKAYLEYSMYVILDRALPHIGDGLKPVQRRIIYAMSELGLKSTAKFKKSARTVGDVLGKFHPHGDMACYEALVLMGQAFSYRYPLIQGQGNFGSPDDPKSFAAMRYTESRLSAYADSLLSELEAGAVQWVPNFDGTLREPALFPARLPNVLLNGTMGIAVGMSTDIPPHCLIEVVNALIYLLDHPQASLEEICRYILGPDYPTGGEIITPASDILNLYRSGSGSIRLRATYREESGHVVIMALPYQVSGAKILEQIAQQMHDKKLSMISDLRDESDHETPIRLVIVPRSHRVDIAALMDHLFATTDLERSYRVNLNMIGVNGRPQVKGLMQILNEWLAYRRATVRSRLEHRAAIIEDRLHLLAGLMIVYLHLDEVIRLIREQDDPKLQLIKRFELTQIQVDAILDLKLRHLAQLEEAALCKEQRVLIQESKQINATLKSTQKFNALIREELLADSKKYNDPRRSLLVERQEAHAFKETESLATEAITIVLSRKGWVRAAKGHEIDPMNLSYKSGDHFFKAAKGFSQQIALFFDSVGRVYTLAAHTLASARGQGEPLTGRLSPPLEAEFVAVMLGEASYLCVLMSEAGYGFVTTLGALQSKNRRGKMVLSLPNKARPLVKASESSGDQDYIAFLSYEGYLLILSLSDVPRLNKGKGNKLINIPKAALLARKEYLLDFTFLTKEQSLVLASDTKTVRFLPHQWQVYLGERGKRGHKLPRACKGIQTLTAE